MASVLVEASRAGRRGFIPQHVLDAMSVDEHTQRWAQNLARSEAERVAYGVAVIGDEVVGFAGVQPTPDPNKDSHRVGQLHGMFVRSDCWGQGIGRNLLRHAVETFARFGFREATLWTEARNDRSRRFYEANGWWLDGATKTGSAGTYVRYRIDVRGPDRSSGS